MRLYKIVYYKRNRKAFEELIEFATDADAMAYALSGVRVGEGDRVVVFAL